MELSILMPCLNEAETIAVCVKKARTFLSSHNVDGEIVVADNGSEDGSQAIVERLGVRLVSVKEKGYGSALMGGIRAARGRYIIMGDADDSYDFLNLMPFLEKLRDGHDLVMGNRFRGGIAKGAMKFLHKYLGNPVLTGIGRLFFRSPCGDFHCGIRGFSKDAVLKMDLRTPGMEFASEMVVKASLLGMKITEVPTILSPDGRSRPPHLQTWRDGWRHLRFLLLYSPRWLFLYPGLVLMSVGSAVMLWLLPGPVVLENTVFDVHSMLYGGMAILIGFQAVVLAVFTKVFAVSEGLLPGSARMKKWLKVVTLEVGLIVGGFFALAGLAGSVYAVGDWGGKSFGPLDPAVTMRVVIPALVCMTLGFQILLSSFFLSVLRLRRHKMEKAE